MTELSKKKKILKIISYILLVGLIIYIACSLVYSLNKSCESSEDTTSLILKYGPALKRK